MTPAERAIAVAFAQKNCELEAITPNDPTRRAARDYVDGNADALRLIAVADSNPHDPAGSVFARTVLLAERGWNPTGDLAELKAIHRALFGGVYDDAGLPRTKDVKDHSVTGQGVKDHGAPRAQAAGTRGNNADAGIETARDTDPEAFFPAVLIDTGAMNISTELNDKRNLRNLDRDVFVRELAKIYDELGYLHPFKGGNAMVLRIFASRLAHDAGWDLDWGAVTRYSYNQAKRKAYTGDVGGFEQLFGAIARTANPTRVFLCAGWDQGPAH
ncbi:Fic/DOC family protein [Bifidobacterium sp.]|jgi:cell filamentation protein|uniref:Fic/DOC family protein n=1 Tax=Bifidobacterium sp. TaxID=41200 RepID=UPI0025BE1B41|nr:Fic family protein [Bifidobacterium sp.]MCI1225495.1 Fic family protein [Bifidobacterium sp.]